MDNSVAIEISANLLGMAPVQLLRCAYRASQSGLITLILNGVDACTADRVLDPVVARMPLTIPGVAYLSIENHERVREVVLSASAVLVTTAHFRATILELGVVPGRIRPAQSLLTRLGSEAVLLADNGPPASARCRSRQHPIPQDEFVGTASA
jgi:hypothetical protein